MNKSPPSVRLTYQGGQHQLSKSSLGGRFWRLWAATGISSIGDGMVLIGFPLLALTYTHNSLLIAGVAVASRLPGLVIALPAGALADRVNRRRMLVSIEIVRFLTLGAFTLALAIGAASLVGLYATVLVLGTMTAAYQFAAAASLPTIVPGTALVDANAQLFNVEVTSRDMLGQAIGGVAFSLSTVIPFLTDAFSFAASARILRTAIPDNPSVDTGTSLIADLRAGVAWFLRHPVLRLLAGLIASFAFCQALVLSLFVLYATDDLHLSKGGYGLLLAISAISNTVAALATGRLHTRFGSAWCVILAGAAAALAYPVLARTTSDVAACGALALETFGVMVGVSAARGLRQSTVPQALQGRVASAHQMLVLAAWPVGGLTGGILGAQIGIRSTFLLAGCLQMLVVLTLAPRLLVRSRRRVMEGRPVEVPVAA